MKSFKTSLASKSTILIPEDLVQQLPKDSRSRVKVKTNFNGKSIDYHAALKRHSSGDYLMYFSKGKQDELGIAFGEEFTVQLFEDDSKYGVDLPEELEAVLLTDYEAYKIFESFTKGKQRSIIYAVKRYKSSQTKIDKSLLLCSNLKRGFHDQKLLFKEN
ncbi:YdeI/OmpD-associated family protein [Winogradskyella maritima]|uniref:YdeI/OmpD-associated family protein n=1 Tax=Winogradskyella maritima TaxID=1517766 RepID=A0ABV8AHU1_9FLAO|nr:YdeI/OmpD-associated family protein [Winogradskyella maritima]